MRGDETRMPSLITTETLSGGNITYRDLLGATMPDAYRHHDLYINFARSRPSELRQFHFF